MISQNFVFPFVANILLSVRVKFEFSPQSTNYSLHPPLSNNVEFESVSLVSGRNMSESYCNCLKLSFNSMLISIK